MRSAALALYAVLFTAIVAFQAWGALKHRTMTAGELFALLVRWAPMRWLLVIGWLWWGWHVFVRVEL